VAFPAVFSHLHSWGLNWKSLLQGTLQERLMVSWNRRLLVGASVLFLSAGAAVGGAVVQPDFASDATARIQSVEQVNQSTIILDSEVTYGSAKNRRAIDATVVPPAPPAAQTGVILLGSLALIRLKRAIRIP